MTLGTTKINLKRLKVRYKILIIIAIGYFLTKSLIDIADNVLKNLVFQEFTSTKYTIKNIELQQEFIQWQKDKTK